MVNLVFYFHKRLIWKNGWAFALYFLILNKRKHILFYVSTFITPSKTRADFLQSHNPSWAEHKNTGRQQRGKQHILGPVACVAS